MLGHLSSTWKWMAVPSRKFRRRIATSITTLVLLGGVAIALLSPIIVNPSRVYADTNCQPNGVTLSGSSWLSGGGVNICNNGSSSADDYGASCVAVSGAPGGSGCSAGYVYAAEKWQCVELVNRLYLTKGWTKATWWGNGNTLVNNVPSGLSKQNNGSISYVNPGDVITLDNGGFGHAGIINTVDSNGTVHIKNQNTGSTTDSSAYIDSGSLGNKNAHYHMNGWSKYWIQAIVHHPISTTPPLRIGALYTSGSYIVKENNLSSGWITMSNDSATQIMQNGTLSGMIWNGGFYVKQGALTNNWVTEANPGTAAAGSISDAVGSTPIRIGLLLNTGSFYVREGLYGNWVDEYDGVVAGYVSGSRVAVLTNAGAFLVKEGSLTSGWVTEYSGNVSQGIINGSLIGVVIGGTLLVKQGGLGAGWVIENGAVANAQLSDATSSTPLRIGVIYTNGDYQVKEGLSGGWVTENGTVSQASISGNLIGVVIGGTLLVKQGGLGAGWVTENGNITQTALWSPN